jgi:hypothetical protein
MRHNVRDEGVAGSNPATPTTFPAARTAMPTVSVPTASPIHVRRSPNGAPARRPRIRGLRIGTGFRVAGYGSCPASATARHRSAVAALACRATGAGAGIGAGAASLLRRACAPQFQLGQNHRPPPRFRSRFIRKSRGDRHRARAMTSPTWAIAGPARSAPSTKPKMTRIPISSLVSETAARPRRHAELRLAQFRRAESPARKHPFHTG